MCGRYTLRELDLLRAGLGFDLLPDFEEFTEHVDPKGMFNIAPSFTCPVIRLGTEGTPTLHMAKWGLIPSWTKGKPKMQPINARSETVATSGMFRQALEKRRCLVPADGFYEWKGAKPPKQPYFIHLKDDAVFAFAGLWERWKPDEAREPLDTFTIITTTPNSLMESLHDRMPVILDQGDYERWLDPKKVGKDVVDLLKPFPAKKMETWPVSSKVNSPENQGPDLIDRVR